METILHGLRVPQTDFVREPLCGPPSRMLCLLTQDTVDDNNHPMCTNQRRARKTLLVVDTQLNLYSTAINEHQSVPVFKDINLPLRRQSLALQQQKER